MHFRAIFDALSRIIYVSTAASIWLQELTKRKEPAEITAGSRSIWDSTSENLRLNRVGFLFLKPLMPPECEAMSR